MDEPPELLTIGQLADRTGIPVRTLRFWSDEGALPPATRSAGGYRLYDVGGAARAELVRTLRELSLGLDEVVGVLDGRTTLAAVADTHVAAIDTQIRALKVSRAVLSTVSKRHSTAQEAALMNRLARISAGERLRIIDDFKHDVFGDLDLRPELRDRLRALRIDLPDEPTPDQVDAWIELAELVQDPGFRARMRTFLELSVPTPAGEPTPPGARVFWAREVVEQVRAVRERGVGPGTPGAAAFVAATFGDAEPLAAVLACVEAGIDARAETYRVLVSRVRGQRGADDARADLDWLASALRAAVAR
ncbi:MerR family transcriptional regulator [Cryptosporangium japonicum]|uniref:MerR family transcriptional regulator n=1 Tax=Cryptosporangium japonicum TaxID=80872 RepID=A0ABN0U7L7_9ACTN